MQAAQRAIKDYELPLKVPGKFCKVGICHLPVAQRAATGNARIVQRVGPEAMPRVRHQLLKHCECCFSG